MDPLERILIPAAGLAYWLGSFFFWFMTILGV